MSKRAVQNKQTEFEKATQLDLELFGTMDSNLINEYIYQYGDGTWWLLQEERNKRYAAQNNDVRPNEEL